MNSLLSIAVLIVMVIVAVKLFKPSLPDGYENLSANEAKERLQTVTNVAILDVRTPKEYAEGHIANARMINIYDSDFLNRLSGLDKNKTYFVYCRSGSRSMTALKRMKELGFEKVWNLSGGIGAWTGSGFSLTQ